MEKQAIDDKFAAFIRRARLNPRKFRGAFVFESEDVVHPENPEAADYNIYMVKKGWKTASSTPLQYWEDNKMFHPAGSSYIVAVDGQGDPKVALRVVKVEYTTFDQVDERHTRKEGEETYSLTDWQRLYKAACAMADIPFDPKMDVVLFEFKVLYQE